MFKDKISFMEGVVTSLLGNVLTFPRSYVKVIRGEKEVQLP
jgi:hypothetical protein